MVDRKYSLPTLDKSDHRNITYCVHAWGQGQGQRGERGRDEGREREGGKEREGGSVSYLQFKYIYARDFQL